MQMDIDRDVTGELDREAKRKDRTLCDLFLFELIVQKCNS
jgi:hypothetical protein